MRTRRTRAPPAGFALALPPPEISDEMQVQHKNELCINVDDSNISPVVTTNGPLFPARFFHVNNTNLFVLMDGVSMFTEGKTTTQKEEVTSLLQRKEAEGIATAKLAKKSPHPIQTSAVDSVEAAIRGIEGEGNDACPSCASSVVLPAAARPPSAVTHSAVCAIPALVTSEAQRCEAVVKQPGIPQGYAALFENRVDLPADGLKRKFYYKDSFVKVHGFLPCGAVAELEEKSSSNTLLPSDSAKTTLAPTGESSLSPTTSVATETFSPGISDANKAGKFTRNSKKTLNRTFSAEDVGRTNSSLDLDAVQKLDFIGSGSQGTVHRVMLDEKLYALKRIDVKEVTEATNAVERQGRKRGLVKELNMIRLQRSREPPRHLMQVFNAVATLDNERQHLYVLMELMSFSVEDAQKMLSRFPVHEMMKMTQSTFRKHLAGSALVQKQTEKLLKQQSASCMHLTGRSSYNVPEDWELSIDRQTPAPEIILSILASDVLKGLRELHEEYSIVHCDLKPANVLLDFNKRCFKIADFGCGCQMDPNTQLVRRTGVDLGSKLYKAPERLQNELAFAEIEDEMLLVEFTPAADVWSLGIMLLELSNGVNPCSSFKSDYWNYVNNLKLSRMVKPLAWSSAFYDFIVRCLVRDPSQRWTVNMLLQHPFILRYSGVPREKLNSFMERLKNESETFQRRQQRELLEKQILLSTGKKAHDRYQKQSRTRWKSFTGFLSVAPQFHDTEKFPLLS
ncbi:protein kinase [Trypanosoma cruzi cruzi]|nr:protein kinase [Trypanosoma cruzi cruzi]